MKKIVLFVLMLVSVAAISQPANYLNIRSRYNLIAVKSDSGFHVPGYSTIPAIRGGVWNGAGNIGIDTVNNKFYFYSGGAWREAGSTNYADSLRRSGLAVQMRKNGNWTTQYTDSVNAPDSFSNGLTKSGGVVKLGGVLSNNTIIGGDSVYFSFSNIDSVLFKNGNSGGGITLEPSRNGTVSKITLTNDEGLKMLIQTGDGYLETLSGFYIRNESDNSALSINAKSGGQEAPLIEVIEGVETIFLIDDDSFHLKPNLGNLYIDSLNTVSSTTGRKVLVHDTATGKVERVDPSVLGGWGLTGNTVTAGTNYIGTNNNASFRIHTNNTLTAWFDSLQGRLHLVNGTDPMVSMKQATTNQTWQLRTGVNTGLSNSSFNIYDATAGKIRFIINQDGDVAIGNVSSIPTVSQLYIYGGGSGANIDARGDSTNEQRDEANIEVEHPDYDGSSFNANGVAMQVNGNVTTGTLMGYPKKNLGQLRFTNQTNFIRVINNRSLRFATNNTERMVLDSIGRLGIGVLSAEASLHVYNHDSGEPTAIFDANGDRTGTIIEARHAGVITSAFDTYGAVVVVDNSAQPTTPASGYSKIYSRLDSLRYMNDAGNEFTLGSVKYDTCTLATFSAGAGLSTDTAAFQTTTIYGSFYNDGSDTLIITKEMAILQGSSPSITPTVYWNDSLNVTAGAVKLVNSPSALTNTATGTAVTSFDNYKIPPGVWVWVATPTVGNKPTYFSLSLIGYKKRI